MRVTLWLLNDRLYLVIDSRSSCIRNTFDVPSPKVFLVTNDLSLTSYLIHKIHKNILCGIEVQPINYAWDKLIFKSKRNRKWFFFCWPATILSIWWDSNRLSMSNFSCRGPRWNRWGPCLYIFWTSQLLEVGRAGSKTGGVHGAKILFRFCLLHCSRIVLWPLPLARTWMFLCFCLFIPFVATTTFSHVDILPEIFDVVTLVARLQKRGKVCLLFLCCAH
jgi:hypothetical protein